MALIDQFEKEIHAIKSQYPSHEEIRNLTSFKTVADMSPDDRADFLITFAGNPPFIEKADRNRKYWAAARASDIFSLLIRRKANFTPAKIADLFEAMNSNRNMGFQKWPVGLVVSQLQKSLKSHSVSKDDQDRLIAISKWKDFQGKAYYGTDFNKARAKLLGLISDEDTEQAPFPFSNEGIGIAIANDLDAMTKSDQQNWYRVFHEAATATGAKPTKKFSTGLDAVIEKLGKNKYKSQMQKWLADAVHKDAFIDETKRDYYNAGALSGHMQDPLKGLVWGMLRFHDEKSLSAVAAMAEKSFARVPGVGPGAAALGNACIHVLANTKGLNGVAHLSRLKLRIKQNNTQKLIQKHIDAQAEKQGLKSAEIEEMAAPDFGLALGARDYSFKEFTFRIETAGPGEVKQTWLKPDGHPQKTVPSFIKDTESLKTKLQSIRGRVKDIKMASSAQRDRIDRLYTEDMSWDYDRFQQYYLKHGLVGPMARKLIWTLSINGKPQAALFVDGQWQDNLGKAIKGKPDTVMLWHPIDAKTADVLAWRDRLEALEIRQPFKQAYREVYILTDAEVNTRIYSNRMAAHILKQHQFNTLAAIRGWKYSLMGAYDDGRDNEIAQKPLPAYKLTAEFWIDEILDEGESFNDAGIWDFVATDQIRFVNEYNDTVDLVNVPPIILSEILRDADLFVGVASIGNDPTWLDRGGAPRTREYWQHYSFGDLTETAKTRKAVLERLLPRLKIRDIAKIQGKFLIVQGKRHSYKIHIGSGNILIQPDDKYLCIVPGRGKDKQVSTLYLPFEGDRGLSIVLSKAFMLAEDDKITDRSILSQL